MSSITIAPAQLPTKKLEEWRYTDVASLAATYKLPATTVAKFAAPSTTTALIFVDGTLAHEQLPQGVTISKTARTAKKKSATPATFFEELAQNISGYKISVAAGLALAEPLVIECRQRSQAALIRPRIAIAVGAGSAMQLVERVIDEPTKHSLVTTSIAINIASGAHVSHLIEQVGPSAMSHVQSRTISLKKDARYDLTVLAWGTKLGRQSVKVQLTEPGAAADLRGVYISGAGTQSDYQIEVDHQAPDTASSQAFRGTISGTGVGVFSGKITVRPEATNARAHQLNKTLLLDVRAQMFTRPQLQIETDKVKCSHGASIGRISDESLFYLTSRGLSAEQARQQLVGAFLRADVSGPSGPKALSIIDAHIAEMQIAREQ